MSRTTKAERDTYRDFADKSGGDFSDIIHALCHDADRLSQTEALLREGSTCLTAHKMRQWQEKADAFLSGGGDT